MTELTTITITITTYPEKNWEISQFFALDIVPTGDFVLNVFFSEIVMVKINW